MCGGAGRGLGHICRFQGLVPEDKPTQGGLALMLEKVGKDPGRYGETPFVNQRVYFKRHFIDKTQLAPSCVGFCQGGREGTEDGRAGSLHCIPMTYPVSKGS